MNYEELEFAKLDTDRAERTGFPEVVFCEGKPDEYLVEIYKNLFEKDGQVFGTRATRDQYKLIKSVIPTAKYDKVSRILKVEPVKESDKQPDDSFPYIVVCSGGTADKD